MVEPRALPPQSEDALHTRHLISTDIPEIPESKPWTAPVEGPKWWQPSKSSKVDVPANPAITACHGLSGLVNSFGLTDATRPLLPHPS